MMKKPTSPNQKNKLAATQIIQVLREAGFEAYLVGGCVRDMLLNKKPSDFDVATSAKPQEVESLFAQTIPVGKSFGVIIVQHQGASIEVATFREDLGYADGRRPTKVKFSSAKQDALRRDFTINGLYYDVQSQKVVDWVGGQKDLKSKLIRTIGDPIQRFEEDKLRMLRAIRFSSVLGFPIHSKTLQAIGKMKKTINEVSMERVRDELTKVFNGPNPDQGLKMLNESGLLESLYPKTAYLNLVKITVPSKKVVTGIQLLISLFKLLKNSPAVIFYAAFIRYQLVEVASPSKKFIAGDWFANLMMDSQKIEAAEKMCEHLRLSNEEKKQIIRMLCHSRIFHRASKLSISEAKRLLRQNFITNDLTLFSVEEQILFKSQQKTKYFNDLLVKWKKADLNPKQFVSGDDLIQMGLKPGPKVGEVLFEIETMQLENKLHTKKQITDWLSKNIPRLK